MHCSTFPTQHNCHMHFSKTYSSYFFLILLLYFIHTIKYKLTKLDCNNPKAKKLKTWVKQFDLAALGTVARVPKNYQIGDFLQQTNNF